MKKTLVVIAAVGALALSACSSDAESDTTPGAGNQTPQATDNPPPANGDFCAMIANSEEMSNDLNNATDALDDIIENQEDWNSPEAVAALHTQGQEMLKYADDVAAVYDLAAQQAGDPEVAQAFAALAEYFRVLFKGMGQAAVDADSVMDYIMSLGTYLNEDQLSTMMDDLSDAGPIVSEYIYETCGVSGMDF